ncbi:MAG: lacto-N-biose phosphorylase central domain-containing protein [Victivallaceae bacterium]|nr:lacto-N-biose phosphorylase central domain-containing protein [Victivallaceae bacterium]
MPNAMEQGFDLSILSENYLSRKRFPFNQGAGAVYCLPPGKNGKDRYRKARRDGLATIAHLSLCFDPAWIAGNPGEASAFYWLSEQTAAPAGTCMLSLQNEDYMHNQVKNRPVDTLHDPTLYWRVFDRTDNRTLSPADWRVSADYDRITILRAQHSHIYQAAYLVFNVEVNRRSAEFTYLDPGDPRYGNTAHDENVPWLYLVNPLSPASQQHTLRQLETFLNEWEGDIDLIRILLSCRYTTFMDKEGKLYGGWDARGEKIPGWNWYGYGRFAHPDTQLAFTRKTGIEFDINWLLRSGYGQIKYPPAPEYLAWVDFINGEIMDYHVKISGLCARYGVKVQTNIGDNWTGIEPYRKNFARPAFHSIGMYGLGRPIANRMLTDFKDPAERVLKIWFASEAGSGHYGTGEAAQKLIDDWNKSKRALFFRFPDTLRLEALDEKADIRLKQAVSHMVNEFFDYKKLIGGQQVYCHPITIYILNCWGSLRAWTAWGDDAGESQSIIQAHLVDMPFRIKWLSFTEISHTGIPEDADIIFNFGPKGTAWSGGYMWNLPQVESRIEEFVKSGGAFLGIDAPGFYDGKSVLARLLGIVPGKGINDCGPQRLRKTTGHWISADLPEYITLTPGAAVKDTGTKLTELFSNGNVFVSVADYHRGRIGYINGYSSNSDYYRLLKRMFFWLCRRENRLAMLYTPDPDVFLYLYKCQRILIIYNMSELEREVKVKFDLKLFGGKTTSMAAISDIFGGRTLKKAEYGELKNGIALRLMPWESKFTEITITGKN